jgi:formate dehydrogenase subunit delta
MDIETLRYMANQIARNFAVSGEETAIAATVQHIRDFWDPRMKAAIISGEQRNPLADTDAHRCKRIALADAHQLFGRSHRKARARHPERMAKRNRTAVGIYPRIIVAKAELAKYGQTLCSKCFVKLDHCQIVNSQPVSGEQLAG